MTVDFFVWKIRWPFHLDCEFLEMDMVMLRGTKSSRDIFIYYIYFLILFCLRFAAESLY